LADLATINDENCMFS